MKRVFLLLSFILMAALGMTTNAQVTINVNYGNGTLYKGDAADPFSGDAVTASATGARGWISNASSGLAGVKFYERNSSTAGALGNHFAVIYASGTSATSSLYLHSGTSTSSAIRLYFIEAPEGYYVDAVNISFKNRGAAGNVSVSANNYNNTNVQPIATGSGGTNTFSFGPGNQTSSMWLRVKNTSTAQCELTSFAITLKRTGEEAGIAWSASSATFDTETSQLSSLPTFSNPHGVSVNFSSSDDNVATVDASGNVTPLNPGTTTITASSDVQTVGGTTYSAAEVSYTLTVTGPDPAELAWSTDLVRLTMLDAAGKLPTLTNPHGVAVTFSSSDPTVATVDANGVVTRKKVGTTVITANSVAQNVGGVNYKACSVSYTLQIIDQSEQIAESAEGALYPYFANPGWSPSDILQVFYDVIKDGRQFPEETDWESHGFTMEDVAFNISHVRQRSRIKAGTGDHSVNSTSYWKQNRQLYLNTPAGTEKNSFNGYPNAGAVDDIFSMWNYVDLHGSWNHSFGHTPGAWMDAAHKNGASMSAGLIFVDGNFETARAFWMATDNTEPSGYKWVRAVIAMLQYFGQDGFTINQEPSSSTANNAWKAFGTALFNRAAEVGFDDKFKFGYYTQNSSYNSSDGYAALGASGSGHYTSLMLNYSSDDISSNMATAYSNYSTSVGSAYAHNIYAGVLMTHPSLTWTRFGGNEVGICLWGEHAASRIWTNNRGDSPRNQMDNYNHLQEQIFSGSNRNPNTTPAVQNMSMPWALPTSFHGMASMMAERSSLVGELPFQTHFQLGNGFLYNYKGRHAANEWYNMSAQDIVPTYRWLVVNDASAGTKVTNTSIVPRFSYDDAYMGGSMLKITGNGSTAGDVVLYKSQLTVGSTNPVAIIAVKTPIAAGATNMQLKLQVNGSWKTFEVGSTGSTAWEEKTIQLSGVNQGDVIQNIALRMKSISTSTKLFVGKLELNDDCKATPASLKKIDVKIYNERSTAMTIKAWWDVNCPADEYGVKYNDAANIDHFEILYKTSQDAEPIVIARTQQWAVLAPNIIMKASDDPWIGVRPVSTDLKTYGEVMWQHVGHNTDVQTSEFGDGYGIPYLSSIGANSSNAKMRSQQWIKSAYTTGATEQQLDYEKASTPYQASCVDGSVPNGLPGYPCLVNTCDQISDDKIAKVNPGDNVNFFFTHPDNDSNVSLSYCVLTVFNDWYGSGYFVDDASYAVGVKDQAQYDSPYYQSGQGGTDCKRKFTFEVPSDAKPGKTRIRLIFQDAWTGFAGATSSIQKGVGYDFPIEVMDIGQEVGSSPYLGAMDEGKPFIPEGLPGAPISSWANILDGSAYYLTDYTSSSNPVVLYNNSGTLASVASNGDPQESLINGNVGDKYNGRFVARREGNQIMFVNGHGEYLGTATLTENYSNANENTAADGSAVSEGLTISINGRPMLLKGAEYPLTVVLKPTQNVTIEGITDPIGIATWSAPFETVLPEGVDAYSIVNNDSQFGYITLFQNTNAAGERVVPANTGVILITVNNEITENGIQFQMLPAKSSAATDETGNMLGAQTTKTYDENVAAPTLYYILGAKDGTSATRKLYKAANNGNKLGANKAYLIPKSSGTMKSSMGLVFKGGATGIGRVVEGIDPEAPAYDLQGRRISKDGFKGVYIQNGRKVVKF